MTNEQLAKHKLKPYNVTPDEVMELINDLQRSRQAIKDVLTWLHSDDVKGAFTSAWVHGMVVPVERFKEIQAMWKRVEAETGEPCATELNSSLNP